MHKSVAVALEEVGYLEKRTASQLNEKQANPGARNFTKYARDLDRRPWFYRGIKQGQPWCDVFVDWCFIRAYGPILGRRLLCQPLLSRGAGCRYSFGYYRRAGRIYSEPQPGDQIFFRSDGRVCHTGLVTGVDEANVYTVEGNTSDESGVVANGGCVRAKQYPLDSPSIAGFGRPNYALVKEE